MSLQEDMLVDYVDKIVSGNFALGDDKFIQKNLLEIFKFAEKEAGFRASELKIMLEQLKQGKIDCGDQLPNVETLVQEKQALEERQNLAPAEYKAHQKWNQAVKKSLPPVKAESFKKSDRSHLRS